MTRLLVTFFAIFLPIYAQYETPKIDGRIDDKEWSDAKVYEDFGMIVPKTTEKYFDKTIVYIKQSPDAMYFAVKFWPKGKVISKSLIRDRSTDEENEFFILLDLENKRRNGYVFSFSFLNNQRDAIIYNERNQSYEWDWIWECKSTIFSEAKDGEPGYIESEVRIPVDKIQNKNKSQIGVDVQLFGYRPDGQSFFYSINPESELLTLKSMVTMNIQPFNERLNLNFTATPYVVMSQLSKEKFKQSVGGEVNVSLDRQTLKGTFNTDQSTLEADPFDFSLYRKPIFLREKRPFFSKDLDIYRTPINLFYTRAITDIHGGLNYTYRSNSFKAGIAAVEEEPLAGDTTNQKRRFLVARPNLNFKNGSLGSTLIYSKDPLNNYTEKIASIDGRVVLKRWSIQPQIITNTKGLAYRGNVSYLYNPAGGPYADAVYARYDKKFDALTVFNNYGNDYDEINVGGGYQFVYSRSYFSNLNMNVSYYSAKKISEDFTHQENINSNLSYKAADWVSVNHYFEYNRPDEIKDSAKITRTNFLEDHSVKFVYKNHSLDLGYNSGPYYGSFLHNPYATMELNFLGRIGINLSYRRQNYSEEDKTIYRVKLDYRIYDKLYLRSFYQRQHDPDKKDLNLWNSLLQYEFFAGSNLYFVLNLQGDKLDQVGQYFKVAYEFVL